MKLFLSVAALAAALIIIPAATAHSQARHLPRYISWRSIAAARRTGWAVDASKHPSIVTVLHYSRKLRRVTIARSIAAAYGDARGPQYKTTDGVFHIYAEYKRNFVSTEYDDAPMPWAACFDGGQCLHYDKLWPSHGCIHIPSMPVAKFIGHLPIGTTVVVHE